MTKSYLSQFNKKDGKQIKLPESDKPLSTSEKLVREEVRRLAENAEEIKKLKEQIITPKSKQVVSENDDK